MNDVKERKGMRTFLVVWAGQLVSTLGSGLTGFALGIWVYETTQSTTLFALNMIAHMLPNIIFMPIIGALVDRLDRRIVMILSDTGAGLSTLFIALMYFTGGLQVWHVYLATFTSATFTAFQWPAYSAATTLLVPKKHLSRSAGMVQIGEAISQLISPAIGGVLYIAGGPGVVVAIDAATFLFAVGTLLLVRFPRPEVSEESEKARGSIFKEGMFGWKYIIARKGLLGLLLYFAAWNLFWGVANVVLFPLILNLTTADVLGYLASIVGVAMLIGTVAVSVWGGPKRKIIGVLGAGAIGAVGTMVMGLRPSIPLIASGGFLMMMMMPFGNASSQALWQIKVHPDLQGRVFAARRMIAWSTTPIGYLIAGPLADRVFEPAMQAGGWLAPILGPIFGTGDGRGLGVMISLVGLLIVASSFAAYAYGPTRRVEAELPDVIDDPLPEDDDPLLANRTVHPDDEMQDVEQSQVEGLASSAPEMI